MRKQRLLLFGFPDDEAAEIAARVTTVSASTTNSSLAILAETEIDAILVIIGALPLSARSLLAALRDPARTTKAGIPVIAILGKSEPKMEQNMVKIGFDQFLIRPFTVGGLLREVEAIVEQGAAPLVKTETYVGPNRRRLNLPATSANPKRRNIDC